jgi:hypothetical protein
MGLMQLLTVGRSLRDAQYRPHRYKVVRDPLPVLGGRPGGEVGRGQAGSGARVIMSAQTVSETNAVKPAFPKGRWTLKANPFRANRPVVVRVPQSVQGELSLDNVKPVRNDLTDSDLELVPLKPAPKPPEAAVPVPAKPAAGSWWARLKGRFARRQAR